MKNGDQRVAGECRKFNHLTRSYSLALDNSVFTFPILVFKQWKGSYGTVRFH